MKLSKAVALVLMFSGWHGESLASVQAGIAVVEITPPLTQKIFGYGAERHATAVHDPLFARILVLRSGDVSLALVTSDLHRLRLPRLVGRIANEIGIGNTILAASLSHSAPALDSENADTPWARATEQKILEAVAKAARSLFRAKVDVAQGSVLASHNIRIVGEDGLAQTRWTNPSQEGTAPVDPTVSVLRIGEEDTGKLRAVLVNYACQPAVLGPDSHLVSADYPGALSRFVQGELGWEVACLFAAGASGQIAPFNSRLSGPEASAELENMAQRLGREVVRLARSTSSTEPVVDLKVQQKRLACRNGNGQSFAVCTVLLSRLVALVALPDDLFVEFQLSLSARSPVPATILLSNAYSNGSLRVGPIPTIAAAAEGGFGLDAGADAWMGAGEEMVDEALIQLYRFLGKLDDIPRGRLVVELPDLKSP
ncbi:MAG: hypothetical protein FJW26_14890 [Acidimicrobiia bacterium]|nr:hypothetical protein [Acidimicrobiia bacterium]